MTIGRPLLPLLVVATLICPCRTVDDIDIQKIKQNHPVSKTLYQTFTEIAHILTLGTISKLVQCPDQFACIVREEGRTIGLLEEPSTYISNGRQLIFMPVIEDVDHYTGLHGKSYNG